jgi:hypothetical protein
MSLIAALSLAAAPPAPPPPIVQIPPAAPSTSVPRLVSLVAGEATCDGASVTPVHVEAPSPSRAYGDMPVPPVVLSFRIDANGRPLGIAPDGGRHALDRVEYNDLQPAFAAWRFAPGLERPNCRIAFTSRRVSADDAHPVAAYGYAALVTQGRPNFDMFLSRALFDRARGPGSDCDNGRPQPRRIIFPELDRVPQRLGGLSFVMTNYDIDKAGKPVNVRVIGSNGNADLNRRGVEAIRGSRFAPEARHGCVHFFYRNPPGPLPAPDAPSAESLRDPASDCPSDEGQPWKKLPALVFPDNFRRRSIEGWAILRYDVAPWGQVGNVSVLAAEPASQFGDSAVRVLSGALKPESRRGFSGCVERVVFKMDTAPRRADD